MSNLARLYRASAHALPMVETGSVQSVITSPPYFGLRKYDGEQDIEWPTVIYAPIAGMAAITVQGCEADCEHEWAHTTPVQVGRNDGGRDIGGRGGNYKGDGPHKSATGGAYCQKCGGWRGPLGNEPTIEAYIAHLILCAREWRRCLHDTGTLFCNLGDSYAGSGAGGGGNRKGNEHGQHDTMKGIRPMNTGIPAKNLLMVPARFALAMQADGWILRSEMIWAKPNPMPESVTDRPTKAHEMIYLFSKQERYFWDADAVRTPHKPESIERDKAGWSAAFKGRHTMPGEKRPHSTDTNGFLNPNGRNMRTVLTVATQPYSQAHFAVWPVALVEPMIRAGTSERGCCPTCGKCWRRVVERVKFEKAETSTAYPDKSNGNGIRRSQQGWRAQGLDTPPSPVTVGWEASCDCPAHEPVPCVVMDPFAGSGTTLRVAVKLGRRALGVDLAQEYLDNLAPERLTVQMEMM